MKRTILVSFAVSCFATGLLQAQIRAPKVGVARYADSTVRAVYGIDSAFVIDRQAIGSADAISFSDLGGLLSAAGRITLVDSRLSVVAECDSLEKAPLLNMDGGLRSAIAWLPSRQALLHWNGESFVLTRVNGAVLNRVTSVRVESRTSAKLLFSEGDAVFEALVSLKTGDLISMSPLPGIQAPAYQQGSFVLFRDKNGLEIESAGEATRTIALQAADLTFERMSSDWLHLSSSTTGQNWVLHLDSQIARLAELPESPVKPTFVAAVQGQEAAK